MAPRGSLGHELWEGSQPLLRSNHQSSSDPCPARPSGGCRPAHALSGEDGEGSRRLQRGSLRGGESVQGGCLNFLEGFLGSLSEQGSVGLHSHETMATPDRSVSPA